MGVDPHELVPRKALGVATEFLDAFRVTVLHGARQVGKTTMAKELAARLGASGWCCPSRSSWTTTTGWASSCSPARRTS